MKKLSLFGLLGLTGLLAFFATPIYAQEDEAVLDEEQIVAEVEDAVVDDVVADIVVDDELDYGVDEDAVALETVEEDTVEGIADLDDVEDFNSIFEDEEVENMLAEMNLTNEEAAGLLGGLTGLFAGLGVTSLVVCLVLLILRIIAGWRIFARAGEGGWKILIPIYNLYIMYKIAGMKNWFRYSLAVCFVLGLIAGCMGEGSSVAKILETVASVFSGIVAIVATFKLPRKFGWGVFTSILYVLFTWICVLILGFGNFKYQGNEEKTVVEA